jgi:hypothetical protein
MSKQNRDFKGIWIPKEIWLSEDLTLQEKVFYVEIDSLDNEDGCYANNEYFAKFFGLSKVRVSEVINSLVEKGFIKSQINQAEGNKRILKTLIKKSLRPSQTKGEDPHKEKFAHNNTLNNTSNNPSDDFAFPKRPFAELEVNHGIDSKLHDYLDAIAECFKLTRHNLADSRRWEKVCMKAIDSEMPVDRLTGTLKSELIRNANTPHFLSPENILKQAQITNISYGSKFVNEFTGRGLK